MPSDSLSISDLRSLSKAFTRPVFGELGKGRLPAAVTRVAELLNTRSSPVREVLESAYGHLRRSYRAEYVYKNEVASKVIFARHSPRTASMVSELRVGDCILDLAIFNGTSTAYEIKTEYDSLARLPEQLSQYRQVFDKVFVVTHPQGVELALKTAEPEVGVLTLNSRGSLSLVREAASNVANTDTTAIFRTLRQKEYLNILAQTHVWTAEGIPRGHVYAQALSLFNELAPEVAHAWAVKELRKRTATPELVDFVGKLPQSLRTLGLSEALSQVARKRLLDSLELCV